MIDLQGLFRSALMTLATNATRRVGLSTAREGAVWAYTDAIPVVDFNAIHAVDRYWLVAEALGVGDMAKRFRVPINDAAHEWAVKIMHGMPRPWLVFGTMGGDGQAQTHLQLLSRIVDDGWDIGVAIDAPRWFVTPNDWSVTVESRFPSAVIEGLRGRGHRVSVAGPYDSLMGHAQAIQVTREGYSAASDPRTEGAALGL